MMRHHHRTTDDRRRSSRAPWRIDADGTEGPESSCEIDEEIPALADWYKERRQTVSFLSWGVYVGKMFSRDKVNTCLLGQPGLWREELQQLTSWNSTSFWQKTRLPAWRWDWISGTPRSESPLFCSRGIPDIWSKCISGWKAHNPYIDAVCHAYNNQEL